MMNKKNLPHIITVVAFVVFIVLGLACASLTPAESGDYVELSLSAPNTKQNTKTQRYTAEGDFNTSGNSGKMIRVGDRFIYVTGITGYKGRNTDVRIPPIINRLLVTSIESGAFVNKQLTSVTIPDMVNVGRINTIDYQVAIGSQKVVDGYAGISSIGEGAFANNPLTSLAIGNGVVSIGEGAFTNNKLTSIIIPDSVTTIGDGAFFGAWDSTNNKPLGAISNITFGNKVTAIGAHAFENNSLTNITIPNSVTIIGDQAFCDNQLTNVFIPGTVKELGKKIFANNQNISITIQNGVTSIGEETFADTPITSITIPGSVRSIGKNAFASSQLTSITIENGITNIGDQAFANLPLTSITIPNSVTHLAGNAFTGTNNLTQITIGPNVTITGNELMPFNFRGAYLENSLRGGTYTFTNGRWVGQFR